MNTYEENKNRSDKTLPAVIRILQSLNPSATIAIATPEEDRSEGIDLIINDRSYVSVRVRTWEVFLKYPNDFTLRRSKGRDGRNEIDKMKDGKIGQMIYGFETPDGNDVHSWTLLDMDVWRKAERDDFDHATAGWGSGDRSQFVAYEVPSFSHYGKIIVAEGMKELAGVELN